MKRILNSRWALASTLTVSLLLIGTAVWAGYDQRDSGHNHTISGSYAFDVTDEQQLAGHADDIFIGTVEEKVTTEQGEGPPRTVYQVRVGEVLKGDVTGTVMVAQLGADIGEDSWRTEDQELLQPQQDYVLVTTHSQQEPGRLVLLGGPSSSEKIIGSADRQAMLDRWQSNVTPSSAARAFAISISNPEYSPVSGS